MGRHSASQDDADDADTQAVEEPAAAVTGRHAVVEAVEAGAAQEEPLVALDEVAAGDGALGLIVEQMVGPTEAEQPTEPVAPLEPQQRPEASAPTPAPQPAPPARGNQSTAADLALLREHSAVRARVIAALVVPFVLYTAVMFLIGAVGVYLIWIWIPLVTAGVGAGSILDAEHRRRGTAPH